MYHLQRLALLFAALISLIAVAVGAFRFSVEFGQSPLRYVLQDAAVVTAGILGLFYSLRQSTRLKAQREAELSAVPVFTGQRFEADAHLAKQGLLVGFLILMTVVAAMWTLKEPGPKSALVFGLMLAVSVFLVAMLASMRRAGQPTLVMDAHGLDHAWFGRVRWDQIHGLFLKEVEVKQNRVYSLQLGVTQPDRYWSAMPLAPRLMQGRMSSSGAREGVLDIPLNALNRPPQEILAAANALRGRVSQSAIAGWYPTMQAKDMALAREMQALTDDLPHLTPEEASRRMEALAPRMRAMGEELQDKARRETRKFWLWTAVALLAAASPLLLAWLRRG